MGKWAVCLLFGNNISYLGQKDIGQGLSTLGYGSQPRRAPEQRITWTLALARAFCYANAPCPFNVSQIWPIRCRFLLRL